MIQLWVTSQASAFPFQNDHIETSLRQVVRTDFLMAGDMAFPPRRAASAPGMPQRQRLVPGLPGRNAAR